MSLKRIASDYVGFRDTLCVRKDLFQYDAYGSHTEGGGDGFLEDPPPMSLKSQLEVLHGKCLGINLVWVGTLDYAEKNFHAECLVHYARTIFAKVGIGIHRINVRILDNNEVSRYLILENDHEARNLTRTFCTKNGFLDIFIVHEHDIIYTSYRDWIAWNGPCDGESNGSSYHGVMLVLHRNPEELFSKTTSMLAFLMGAYLNAQGNFENFSDDQSNFMFWPPASRMGITENQGENMKKHCYVTELK